MSKDKEHRFLKQLVSLFLKNFRLNMQTKNFYDLNLNKHLVVQNLKIA